MRSLRTYKTILLLHYVQRPFLCVCRFLSFLLSGSITLKVIFYYFRNYIFKAYKCIYQHFEKPNRVLFQQYAAAPLFLHLRQWEIENEEGSLAQILYAVKPRNPE